MEDLSKLLIELGVNRGLIYNYLKKRCNKKKYTMITAKEIADNIDVHLTRRQVDYALGGLWIDGLISIKKKPNENNVLTYSFKLL